MATVLLPLHLKDLTPSDLDPEQVEVLLRQKTEGPDQLGRHPETGEPFILRLAPTALMSSWGRL